jgi:short-subunit dehydrogenase
MEGTAVNRNALLIGNSDGIGLATTRRLLSRGWDAIGVSRSASSMHKPSYAHHICDVTSQEYMKLLNDIVGKYPIDLCIYFAGIGEPLDPTDMTGEIRVMDVNLMGLMRTAASVMPAMVGRGRGHLIGISSFADELLSPEAPSYHASKAGFTSYLGGLALALKPKGVYVTNVRFGFVDTKMAKGNRKPFMMGVEQAVDHIEHCIREKPRVHSAPKAAIPFVKFRKWIMAHER